MIIYHASSVNAIGLVGMFRKPVAAGVERRVIDVTEPVPCAFVPGKIIKRVETSAKVIPVHNSSVFCTDSCMDFLNAVMSFVIKIEISGSYAVYEIIPGLNDIYVALLRRRSYRVVYDYPSMITLIKSGTEWTSDCCSREMEYALGPRIDESLRNGPELEK